MATLPPVPQYLRWSEVPITWDRTDHPDLIPTENQYAMVINPLIDGVEFTNCMVDSGSNINIMYLDTLQKMNLTEANLRRTNTIFHGSVGRLGPLGALHFRLPLATLIITAKSA